MKHCIDFYFPVGYNYKKAIAAGLGSGLIYKGLDKLMKGKLSKDEQNKIPPNILYDMKKIVAEKEAYKQYLNYIIDHITL